ncbi:MAG: hypothetical protein K0Q59_4046 [Paenibacillus sp.]|nr:hypothetical protein [Paenibacillus sp.]
MISIVICSNTLQWSRFTDFYIRNRTDIIPNYPAALAARDVRDYIREGRGAILTNDRDEVVGIGSFVLGLADHDFQDKEIAVLGNSCFLEEYRSGRTFIRGLQVLAEQIIDANPDVREVRIPTAAANAYTNRLYRRFADKQGAYETEYGTTHVYSTPFSRFADFCNRYI